MNTSHTLPELQRSNDNRILSIGYNEAPNGYSDENFPWGREGNNLETKYPYVCHAELNAILNYRGSLDDLKGSTLYVTWFPCTECTKEIIQVGIKKVVYLRMYSKKELVDISKIIVKNIKIRNLQYIKNIHMKMYVDC